MTLAELSKKYGVHPNMISTLEACGVSVRLFRSDGGKECLLDVHH